MYLISIFLVFLFVGCFVYMWFGMVSALLKSHIFLGFLILVSISLFLFFRVFGAIKNLISNIFRIFGLGRFKLENFIKKDTYISQNL